MLVGLELEGSETAGHGDEVSAGRQRLGVVTSGTRRPILKKNVALARVAVLYADLGTALEVGKLDGLQKRIAATVVRFPFYDPDKTTHRDRRGSGFSLTPYLGLRRSNLTPASWLKPDAAFGPEEPPARALELSLVPP